MVRKCDYLFLTVTGDNIRICKSCLENQVGRKNFSQYLLQTGQDAGKRNPVNSYGIHALFSKGKISCVFTSDNDARL